LSIFYANAEVPDRDRSEGRGRQGAVNGGSDSKNYRSAGNIFQQD